VGGIGDGGDEAVIVGSIGAIAVEAVVMEAAAEGLGSAEVVIEASANVVFE
jgi:hypothetical protein